MVRKLTSSGRPRVIFPPYWWLGGGGRWLEDWNITLGLQELVSFLTIQNVTKPQARTEFTSSGKSSSSSSREGIKIRR
jgi:hypothetical protein